ncbi:hypothetical protein HDU96_002310, partial [Phlyctochytrium bullatum]
EGYRLVFHPCDPFTSDGRDFDVLLRLGNGYIHGFSGVDGGPPQGAGMCLGTGLATTDPRSCPTDGGYQWYFE